MGADCVHRDPVRIDVLLVYLAKYTGKLSDSPPAVTHSPARTHLFAGAALNILERTLRRRGLTVLLTPREVALAELLVRSRGEVITYETLYNEILGSIFRGDTSNMRVLLGKLTASARSVGITLRAWLE